MVRNSLLVLALSFLMIGCGGTQPPIDAADMAGIADGGLKAFGAACGGDAECDSHICFIGGNRSFCSLHCTAATQTADCPVPPTSGTCNMQGFCKP